MRKHLFLIAPLLLFALPAGARTALQSSDPAEGAKVGESTKITLRFSGALQPAKSGAALLDASGKTVPVASAVSLRTITLLPFHLRPGPYRIEWHSLGQDQTSAKGAIGFTVAP
jgi:methionine-rich copper-binding protein CopC